VLVMLGGLAPLLAGCASGVPLPSSAGDAAGTMWLCRPGLAADPCGYRQTATAVDAGGSRTPATLPGLPSAATASKFACFYVYPTVSDQPEANTNLTIAKPEAAAAVAQASPFSRVCGVWAPMYRSATAASVALGLAGNAAVLHSTFTVAYDSVLAAWRDFLARDDRGRPIVLIGDSQGSAILIRLIATQIDRNPAVRRRLLVAILAGGNLQVPAGRTAGATFANVPLCAAAGQAGCVIAWSSFPARPPAGALFGYPGQGVSLQSGQSATAGQQVACVNPAALAGGTASLRPYFPAAMQPALKPSVTTPWVSYPQLYSARCENSGGASWLQVSVIAGQRGHRPVVTEALGPQWGYHVDDISLALGNLLLDVARTETAWLARH
jgi:hypothetical protein